MGIDAERLAGEDDEIGVLAGLEGTDAIFESEDAGIGHGEGVEGFFARHAAPDGETGHTNEEARIGNRVVRMQAGENSGLFEHSGTYEGVVLGFQLAAGAIDQDQRDGNFGRGDLARHHPGVADVMQDELEIEFLGKPDGGEDVVVAVRVELDGAFAFEHLDQTLHAQIARRQLGGIALGGADFIAILLGLDELFADQGDGLGASSGEGGGTAGIGAVGHFHAAGDASIGEPDEHFVDGVGIAQLEVERLAAEQMAGSGHDVGGGDAAGAGLFDIGIADIDGVENARIGLDGATGIAAFGRADVAMGIDQTGQDHFSRGGDAGGSARNRGGGGWSHGDNLADLEDQGAVRDFGSADGNDAGVGDGDGRGLRVRQANN